MSRCEHASAVKFMMQSTVNTTGGANGTTTASPANTSISVQDTEPDIEQWKQDAAAANVIAQLLDGQRLSTRALLKVIYKWTKADKNVRGNIGLAYSAKLGIQMVLVSGVQFHRAAGMSSTFAGAQNCRSKNVSSNAHSLD